MVQTNRTGKNYSENKLDYFLTFNEDKTWTVASGTGSGLHSTNKSFTGTRSLQLYNTAPTTDLVVTNSEQNTIIDIKQSNFGYFFYVYKENDSESYSGSVEMFQNAVSLGSETFTLEAEQDEKWYKFISENTFELDLLDEITFKFTFDGDAGFVGAKTIYIDGFCLYAREREDAVPPIYTSPKLNAPVVATDTGTGWAQYGDSQYTEESPLSCADSIETIIDIDGLGSTIKSQLPIGVTDLYDTATSKILPVTSGDGFAYTISFKAEATATNSYASLGVDIGGGFDLLFERTITFPRGSSTTHPFTFTTIGYELSTFLSNGGVLKITSGNGTVTIWDIILQIHRIHKAV